MKRRILLGLSGLGEGTTLSRPLGGDKVVELFDLLHANLVVHIRGGLVVTNRTSSRPLGGDMKVVQLFDILHANLIVVVHINGGLVVTNMTIRPLGGEKMIRLLDLLHADLLVLGGLVVHGDDWAGRWRISKSTSDKVLGVDIDRLRGLES